MLQKLTEKQWAYLFPLLFLLFGFILLPIYKYQINPDAIAYVSIAKHYANGNWMEALNSCWPPLISWLLAPWHLFEQELLWVFKAYNIVFGAGCLLLCYRIMKLLKIEIALRVAGQLVLVFLFMMWAFHLTSPDLLSVLLMLVYAKKIISGKFLKQPVFIGILGALAYFAKSYCFFFFLLHLCFHYLWYGISKRQRWQSLYRPFLISILSLGFISFAWMYLLSTKYGTIQVSSASAWTHGMVRYKNLDCINQVVAPPHKNAVFAWEDPPLVCPHRDWSMFDSLSDFLFQVNVVLKNTAHFFRLQLLTGYFFFACFLLGVFAALFSKKANRIRVNSLADISKDPLTETITFVLLYTSGYLLIFIEPRYVWIGYALLFIAGLAALQRFIDEWGVKKTTITRLFVLASALFFLWIIISPNNMLVPLKKFFGGDVTYRGYEFYQKAKQIDKQINDSIHIASWGDNKRIARVQSWSLAYYAKLRHYGVLPDDTARAHELIRQYDIKMVAIAGTDSVASFGPGNWIRVLPDVGELRLYMLKD